MTGPLTEQLRKEHAKLMPHVDALRIIADDGPALEPGEFVARLCAEHRFLTSEFVPHMRIEQSGWYPALDLIVARDDVLAPMAHAHDEVERLIEGLGRVCAAPAGDDPRWALEARRALYQLYALLKVHLAEEELQAPLLEAELSEQQATGLAAQLEFGEPPARR